MKLSLFTFCVILLATNIYAQKKTLTLINPLNQARADELIIVKRADLSSIFKDKKGPVFIQITNAKGKAKQLQFDDLNQDGVWDEAVFLHSFRSLEQAVFKVSVTNQEMGSTTLARAYVRHKRKNTDDTFGLNINMDSIPAGQANTNFSKVKLPPFLTEGPAWENDKVGFRLYFDIRNGKDIWGKTTSAMMMDTVGLDPKVIYHHRAPWGMDVYKVGSSLSAGALAINIKLKNGKDSLIRLGGKNMGKVVYEKIADGPLRGKFRLHYPEWKFAEGYQPIALTEEISIWGGQYFYQSDIKIDHAPKNASLVTGFANLFNIDAEQQEGTNSKFYYAYGAQSENKDNLGLAIIAPKYEILQFTKTTPTEKDIKDSYLVFLKIPGNKNLVTFRFYAAWQPTDSRFADSTAFSAFLKAQGQFYDRQIKVNWK